MRFSIVLAALPIFAAASAVPRDIVNSCNTGPVQCCNQVQTLTAAPSPALASAETLALLHPFAAPETNSALVVDTRKQPRSTTNTSYNPLKGEEFEQDANTHSNTTAFVNKASKSISISSSNHDVTHPRPRSRLNSPRPVQCCAVVTPPTDSSITQLLGVLGIPTTLIPTGQVAALCVPMHSESASRDVASPSPGALAVLAIAQKLLDGLEKGPQGAEITTDDLVTVFFELLSQENTDVIPFGVRAKLVGLLNDIRSHKVPAPKSLVELLELLKNTVPELRDLALEILKIGGFDVR
ncbi:hypothetical protein CVT24_007351 [Panaeolus cyanescens]|uniref:Hydrophobin n=1 Tax=Panaeolus cyanescens TaxID=181874 RepID=A0A409W9W5_9AGAR|nr:hypothetical protein CVT24_007351 [Panaeolus cyanescens]